MMNTLYDNVKKTLTLNFCGYVVKGAAVLQNWDDSIGAIKMNEFVIDEPVESKEELYDVIRSLMNDNGFGCRSILGAHVNIYAAYSNDEVYNGSYVFIESLFLDKDNYVVPEKYRKLAEDTYYDC